MKKSISLFGIILLTAVDAFAWRSDSLAEYPNSVSVQIGQPHKLMSADVQDDEIPFNTLHGELNRFSMGAGMTYRRYLDETFFLHVRAAYSTRSFSLYDSTITPPIYYSNSTFTETTIITNVNLNTYKMNNVLIGIGGGHEGRYGKFVVRAGGEIDFIKYTTLSLHAGSSAYTSVDRDTVAGGSFWSENKSSVYDNTRAPLMWGIGIVGHASLEYRVTSCWGIGATMYLGMFYAGMQNGKHEHTNGVTRDYIDSTGATLDQGQETVDTWDFKQRQFDFSPLNGQICVAYYFGNTRTAMSKGPY